MVKPVSKEPGPHWAARAIKAAAAVLVVPVVSVSALVAVVVAEPQGGPGHWVIDNIEQRIGESDEVHYEVHRALGRLFSLCPCTARIARSQYGKAYVHRPARLEAP